MAITAHVGEPQLAIWDVDFNVNEDDPSPDDEQLVINLAAAWAPGSVAMASGFIGPWRAPGDRTSHQHSAEDNLPAPGWFDYMGQALKADARYMRISRNQQASRARLKPKSQNARGDEFVIDARGRFQTAPYREPGDYRACRFIGLIGSELALPSLAKQISFHDLWTEADGNSKELY